MLLLPGTYRRSVGNHVAATRINLALTEGDRVDAGRANVVRSLEALNVRGRIVVEASTNLRADEGIYHWYRDGQYVGATREPRRQFNVGNPGGVLQVDVRPIRYIDWDPKRHPLRHREMRRPVQWKASGNAAGYLVQITTAVSPTEQDWVTVRRVEDRGRWLFQTDTGQLDDDTHYTVRIVPVDALGNQGTPNVGERIRQVRYPDPVPFVATYDDQSGEVTFTEVPSG